MTPDRCPTVAVVIPSYERRATISRTLESIFSQTRPVDEVIVVDDGSTDGTADFLHSFYSDRVRVIENTGNIGASRARNVGIEAASSDWIAFLDFDDAWAPEKIERQLQTLAEHAASPGPDVVGVFTHIWNIASDGTRKRRICRPAPTLADLRRDNLVGSTSTALVRRDALIRTAGFDGDLPSCQDWDLWLRLVKIGRLAVVQEPLVMYYMDAGHRISSRADSVLRGHRAVYRSIYADVGFYEGLKLRRWHIQHWSTVCASVGLDGRAFAYALVSFLLRTCKRPYLAQTWKRWRAGAVA